MSGVESTPALKTVSTKWAAEHIGRTRDTHVRTLLKANDLSFRSERTKFGIADGEVSWWEMVRLDAYEHLKSTKARDNRHLRDGLIILNIPLVPFVVVWSGHDLPVLVRPDQVIDYQMQRGARGAYDPTALLAELGLLTQPQPRRDRPHIRTGEQQALFGNDQLDLFGDS